jgi:hypothetical protein
MHRRDGNLNLRAGVRTSVLLLKALHIIIRAFLVIASAFWLLILLELMPVLVLSGMDGVRGKLLHIWSMGKTGLPWTCQDSLHLVHEGYTDLILFLLLTWAAVELKRFLHRRMAGYSRLPQIPADTR